jgi:serine/threonine protein kinase
MNRGRNVPQRADSGVSDEHGALARYDLLKCIGEGGMGVVYEAFDKERRQIVALKTLLHSSPAALYRFKQEFRALADVAHPNLVRLFEFVATDTGEVFFTMELVGGVDFVRHVRGGVSSDDSVATPTAPTSAATVTARFDTPRRGELGWADCPEPSATAAAEPARLGRTRADIVRLRLALRQLVEGINALHAAGKLHRDIKPSNVLVTPDGRVVLLDFGVAADLTRERDENQADTEMVGTARYMAPEQATDDTPTTASDWYSVGVMLFEVLVGRAPFVGPAVDVITRKSLFDAMRPSEQIEGVPPDLDGLCAALLRREPERRPSGRQILRWLDGSRVRANPSPVPADPTADLPLIGRDSQVRALRQAFDDAREGRLVTVRVSGASGMGKSALAARFVDELVEGGEAVALRGRAYERESMPYKALDSVIDAISRYLMRLTERELSIAMPEDVGSLARLFPVLRRVEAIGMAKAPASGLQAGDVRRRATRALRELLAALSERVPLVIYIDDVQWGDADSASLLVDLVRPPFDLPLLVLLTYREEEVDSSPFLIQTLGHWPLGTDVRGVRVGPLEPADARALALSFSPSEDLGTGEAADFIARESAGSPLLVEELARSVMRSSGLGSPRSPVPLGSLRLEDVIRTRLSLLQNDARRVLEVIAVSARPLAVTMAGDAVNVSERLDEIVSVLRGRRFVRTGFRHGREVVEILHERVREVIVGQMAPETVRAHHGRLAQVLEAFPDSDAEALAMHLFGAGDSVRAGQSAERAADQALAKLALVQALRMYEMALGTVDSNSPDANRLRVRIAVVLRSMGRGLEAANIYIAAAERSEGLEKVERERDAAEQLFACGRIDDGARVLRRILQAGGMRAPRTLIGALFWAFWYRARLRIVGLTFRERDSGQVRRVDDLRIEALYAAAVGLAFVDVILGMGLQARHLFLALRSGNRFQVMRAAAIESVDLSAMGGPESPRERQLALIVHQLADRSGERDWVAFADVCRAMRLFMRARWRQSYDSMMGVLDVLSFNRAGWQSNGHLYLIWALLWMGRIAELRRRHAARLADASERGDRYTTVNLRTGHCVYVWLADDDVETARRHVREAMADWSDQGFLHQHYRAMVSEADIELYASAGPRAYEIVTSHWRALRRTFLLHVPYLRVDAHFLRGRCALASIASLTDARSLSLRLADAVGSARTLDREGPGWAAPQASLIWAGIAEIRGNRAQAVTHLRAAVAQAEAAEMALHANVARARLGELLAGDEGAALVTEAREWMAAQEIRVPARFVGMLAPGFPASALAPAPIDSSAIVAASRRSMSELLSGPGGPGGPPVVR